MSVDLESRPSTPTAGIPGMQVTEQAATFVSADALTATYSATGPSMTARAACAVATLIHGAIVAYFSWMIYAAAQGLRSGASFSGRSGSRLSQPSARRGSAPSATSS